MGGLSKFLTLDFSLCDFATSLIAGCRIFSLPNSEDRNRLDSNLFQSAPGEPPIMAYGSYLQGLFQVPLTLPPLKLNGEIGQIAFNSSNDAMEASYQFQWTVEGSQWYVSYDVHRSDLDQANSTTTGKPKPRASGSIGLRVALTL